jgi:hypothetical protein
MRVIIELLRLPFLWLRPQRSPRRWEGASITETEPAEGCRHQCLYKSRKGRYWLQDWATWRTPIPFGRWIPSEQAAGWLRENNYRLPHDLAKKISSKVQR